MKIFKSKTSKLDKEEFKKLIKLNIIKVNNLDLIILKGHLLIEFLINKFLQSHSDDETLDISKENFQFHQKLKICKMFGILYSDEDYISEQINLVNKLRNNVAHRLEIDYNTINQIKSYYSDSENIVSEKELIKFLKYVIQNICFQLIGRFEAGIYLENELKERATK